MGATTTAPNAEATRPAPRRVAVAASGGRDSTALLHATVHRAAAWGIEVVALHVHHGLMPAADEWQRHVQRQARRWGAAFCAERLSGRPAGGDSVEAWARRERYAALSRMARTEHCPLVLLAQHRRDQAETFLLQALRGGGAKGLAAMPPVFERDGVTFARPWLAQPREAIEAYVRRHRLRFVDDASNEDLRLSRSRLRQQVWPALQAAFADAEQVLALAAARAALEADVLHEWLAAHRTLAEAPALDIAAWCSLGHGQRDLTLRHWLANAVAGPIPLGVVQRLRDELPRLHSARWPLGTGELRLHRGLLAWFPGAGDPVGAGPAIELDLRPGHSVHLPAWRGTLASHAASRHGLRCALLEGLQLRPRQGGEQFQCRPGAALRGLKKQFQAAGVAQWARGGPLIYSRDGALLFVPGLGVDARAWAAPGSPQWSLSWTPDPDPPTRPN